MKEAQAKHRCERSMNSIKEYMIQAIKKKQIEIYGKKLTLKEQVLALNNPVLREKLLLVEAKYSKMKNDIDGVNTNSQLF